MLATWWPKSDFDKRTKHHDITIIYDMLQQLCGNCYVWRMLLAPSMKDHKSDIYGVQENILLQWGIELVDHPVLPVSRLIICSQIIMIAIIYVWNTSFLKV